MAAIPMGDIPSHHAQRLGADTPALRHGEEMRTWGTLSARSLMRANAMKNRGVRPGDFVTIALPNGADFYEFSFAVWKLGATPNIISHRLPRREFLDLVELARPSLVVADDPALRAIAHGVGVDFGLQDQDISALNTTTATYWKSMTSGGSTGRPKLIVDHQPAQFDPQWPRYGLPNDDIILNPGPLYHNAPFSITSIALFKGNAVVGMSKFDAEEALRLIDRHKLAWVKFVPTMMGRIWRLGPAVRAQYDLSSLNAVWHAAAPMPAWLKRAWIEWLGADKIWELYGGTEAQGATVIRGDEWLMHPGSVGRPVNCRVRILDDNCRDAPAGEIGEIYFMPDGGPGTTYHYIGAEARIAQDGWESVGDFGWLDDEGYLYLADRRTDLILSGGRNLYPAEIEAALSEHPMIECAVVIGLPDEDLGARAHAIVQWVAGAHGVNADELADFVGERLVKYKVPKSFEFTTESLRDEAGKVRRSALRDARLAAFSEAPTSERGAP